MQPKRTPAWLWVRLELLAGILTVLIGLQGLVFWTPMWGLGILPSVLAPITALVFAVVGLIWMVRIFRGPTGEPPPWRYREH